MADRVVGYGFLPTISNNGAGKARFTFPPNTIHRQTHALITTDGNSYLWNLTDSEVSAITAKGGTEAGGYYYDSSLDFSGLAWTITDRLHPARGNTISNPTSLSAARTASSNGDVWFMAFSSTAESAMWSGQSLVSNASAPLVDVYCMAAYRTVVSQTVNSSTVSIYHVTGDLSGRATQIKIVGLCSFGGYYGVFNNDTSGSGGGLLLDSCIIVGSGAGLRAAATMAANTCEARDCIFIGCNSGVVFYGPSKAYNCTAISCSVGFDNRSVANTFKNCAGLNNGTDFANLTNVVMSYCASSDGTATGTGSITGVTPAQAKLWRSNCGNFYPVEGRILTTSSLYNAGNYAAGQPTVDLDGNDITTTCPIGAHVGTAQVFNFSWPTGAEVDPLAAAFNTPAGSVTAAMDVPAIGNVTPNDTLRGVTGESTYKSPAQEAADNTDPGEAYVQRQADGGPASYKHLGVTKTPALNTAALESAAYALGVIAGEANNDFDGGAGDIRTGKTLTLHGDDIPGSLTPAPQTATPGEWTLADSGDGQTWTLDVPAGAALTVYTLIDQSSFAKVASCCKPNGMKVKTLVAGRTYHLVATYPGQTESAESATEVVAPALVANYSAGAASILTGSADRVDGAVTNGTASAGATPPDPCHLDVSVSGTTASIALSNLPAAATSVKVYCRLAGEDTWTLGATITMPNTTSSIAALTKSKLYEFQAVTFNGTQVGYPSNLERKWVADTSKFKAILDRVEAEIEALAWTGWATSQVTIAWSPALVKDKAMPRVAVAPGNAPDSIVAQTNESYSVAFPVRLYLMDRVSTRDAQMEALLAKREALRQLFMQRNVLSEVEGVFNVRVEPLPVVNDPDIDERMLITGVELAVEVEEAR